MRKGMPLILGTACIFQMQSKLLRARHWRNNDESGTERIGISEGALLASAEHLTSEPRMPGIIGELTQLQRCPPGRLFLNSYNLIG